MGTDPTACVPGTVSCPLVPLTALQSLGVNDTSQGDHRASGPVGRATLMFWSPHRRPLHPVPGFQHILQVQVLVFFSSSDVLLVFKEREAPGERKPSTRGEKHPPAASCAPPPLGMRPHLEGTCDLSVRGTRSSPRSHPGRPGQLHVRAPHLGGHATERGGSPGSSHLRAVSANELLLRC